MAERIIGISRELIIHPGETIADILEERGVTQGELASLTGVSPAYISNVISGKKGISSKFAMALEYAFGVPKSFWLNLQANYESELLEFNEKHTVSNEEKIVLNDLKEIVKYLKEEKRITKSEEKTDIVLSLRKVLGISNLCNLKNVAAGVFRISSNTQVNENVLGAWVRLCQIAGENIDIDTVFDVLKVDNLINELKDVMCTEEVHLQIRLKEVLAKYGIDFSVVKNFKGAPVHGYIDQKEENIYQMVLTIRQKYADIFWFSLFHEIGHIVNGDVNKKNKFIDNNSENDREKKADIFATNMLLNADSYNDFVCKGNFTIDSICAYAKSQNVMPYIVIGRLQKKGYIPYSVYSQYKKRYSWNEIS